MKHLLIIILSFLLLSSPLFGLRIQVYDLKCEGKFFNLKNSYFEEGILLSLDRENIKEYGKELDRKLGETLYGWKGSSGIHWVTWRGENMPTYKGEIKNGKPNGFGVLCLPKDYSWEYVGLWKDGIFWRGFHYDRKGNILDKYVNGKGIKQTKWLYNVNMGKEIGNGENWLFLERIKKFVFNLF